MEKNLSIQLMLVRHRAALSCMLAQQMNIVLQQESLFTLIPCHLYGIGILSIFKNGSSELRQILHQNSWLNGLCNYISPPSCRPDSHTQALWETWTIESIVLLGFIASGHDNFNVVKPKFPQTTRQNFKLFHESTEKNLYIQLILVRHRAALNCVLATYNWA